MQSKNLDELWERVNEFRREVEETAPSKLDCAELERRAQQLANRVGLELMRTVLMRADTASPTVEINGEQWGNRRVSVGEYTTLFGDLEIERSTYQRAGRGRVGVPVDLRLGIVERRYTPRVTRLIAHATAVMTAEDAASFLKQAGVATVSSSTIHRMALAMAARHETMSEEVTARVRDADPIPVGTVAVQVALDGVMVPQDGEHCGRRGRKTDEPHPPRWRSRYELGPMLGPAGTDNGGGRMWHEASVGTLAFIDAEGHVLKTTYLARMPEPGKATLVEQLHDELMAVVEERPDLALCFASDGAKYHWKVLTAMACQLPEEAHGDVYFLVDFFHVAEYLADAAKAIAGEGTPEATVMAAGWRETLRAFPDGGQRVLKSLRYHRDKLTSKASRNEVQAVINYLAEQAREDRLGYATAKEHNLPIGTGITEAAAKTVVGVRMKRAGARYEEHGGQTVMLFRSAVLSKRFDTMARELERSYVADVKDAA
jgi:hypothetical protein